GFSSVKIQSDECVQSVVGNVVRAAMLALHNQAVEVARCCVQGFSAADRTIHIVTIRRPTSPICGAIDFGIQPRAFIRSERYSRRKSFGCEVITSPGAS